MAKIKWGIIADDFTGASDAASFLVKSGNKTALITDIPETISDDYDCIVVGLKIRSVSSDKAIYEIKKVLDFFEKNHISKIYYKYCSTFDSTPKGNIGPVMDYLINYKNERYSLLCPSLPINGRIVEKGILYVDGVKLNDSSLRNHPLNPMWDSYIPTLMKDQSRYPCYIINRSDMESGLYINQIRKINDKHFYLVPDYKIEKDGELISDRFNNMSLYSGGSGLLEYLSKNNNDNNKSQKDFDIKNQKAIILCGSCSKMTSKQIESFKRSDNIAYSINAKDILDGKINAKDIFHKVLIDLPKTSLIYSDGCLGKLDRNDDDFYLCSKAMEKFLADLSYMAKESNFNKIIVAGGETSGAVMLRLGYNSFEVGKSVAPGVPCLTPLSDQNVRIFLKSGNFGDEYFFLRALEAK